MKKEKPTCSDFIIAAARTVRKNLTNQSPKTSAGVGLHRLFKVACDTYSGDEFKKHLEILIGNGSVIVVARISEITKDRAGPYRELKLTSLPPHSVFLNKRWRLNDKNQPIDPERASRYRIFLTIRIYILVDGISKKLARLESRSKKILADKIIAAI